MRRPNRIQPKWHGVASASAAPVAVPFLSDGWIFVPGPGSQTDCLTDCTRALYSPLDCRTAGLLNCFPLTDTQTTISKRQCRNSFTSTRSPRWERSCFAPSAVARRPRSIEAPSPSACASHPTMPPPHRRPLPLRMAVERTGSLALLLMLLALSPPPKSLRLPRRPSPTATPRAATRCRSLSNP